MQGKGRGSSHVVEKKRERYGGGINPFVSVSLKLQAPGGSGQEEGSIYCMSV